MRWTFTARISNSSFLGQCRSEKNGRAKLLSFRFVGEKCKIRQEINVPILSQKKRENCAHLYSLAPFPIRPPVYPGNPKKLWNPIRKTFFPLRSLPYFREERPDAFHCSPRVSRVVPNLPMGRKEGWVRHRSSSSQVEVDSQPWGWWRYRGKGQTQLSRRDRRRRSRKFLLSFSHIGPRKLSYKSSSPDFGMGKREAKRWDRVTFTLQHIRDIPIIGR